MKKIISIVSFVMLAACSSVGTPQNTVQKNSCVTAGASYLEHFVERPNGTCGRFPDMTENVSPSGEINLSGCSGTPRYVGCDVYLDNISCSKNGITVIENGKMSWASDGASGFGIITLSASNSSETCLSTYDVTAQRL